MATSLPPQAHDLRRQGVSEHAIHWLGKSLHPPSDLPASAVPDRTVASSLFPEYRETAVISVPGGLSPTQHTWDLCIVKCPGNVTGVSWVSGPSPMNFDEPGDVDAMITAGNWGRIDIQEVDATPKQSISGIELAPGPGVTVATPDYPGCSLYPVARPMCWRKAATSLTCYLNAAAVADQGTVYATQVSRVYAPMEVRSGGTPRPDGGIPLYRACPVSLPLTEDEMMASDPKVYMAPARAGVYLPLKPFGNMDWQYPLQPMGLPFVPHGATAIYFPVSPASAVTSAAMECSAHPIAKSIDPASGQWSPNYFFGLPGRDGNVNPYDSGFDEWNTGVVLFRGLALDASVTLRVVDVIQQMPASTSIYRPFVKPAPLFEPKALDLYFRVAEATPNAYPANFNSWGKIWDVIKRVAREVMPIAQVAVPAIVAAAAPEDPEAAVTASRVVNAVGTIVGKPGATGSRLHYASASTPQTKVKAKSKTRR